MKIPFIGPTEEERSRDVDYQKTVNWYLEKSRDGSTLYPTPGSKSYTKVGDGPIRGSIVFDDKLWVVSGDTLYSIDTSKNTTNRGTLATSSGRVSMAHNGKDNGQELFIVDGSKGYIYDVGTSTFDSDVNSTDADFPNGATHVRFIDSYFVVNDPSTSGRWRISDSYDGTTWGANKFVTAERSPDELLAIEVSDREIWLFGENTTEVWYNSGGAAFPFSPNQNGFIEWGIAAKFSVAEADGALFWLSSNEEGDGIVVMAQGYSPKIISSYGVAEQISEMGTISDAFGYVFQFKQHVFYVLTFPTANRTFVYDITMQSWFEWETDGGRHIGNTHTFFNGLHIVGDKTGNNLFQLDSSTYTDNGKVIERVRRSQHISVDDKPAFHHSLVVEMQTGVGNANDPSPQVMLRWSNDGGYTWSNEYWRSLGAVGEYNTQVQWRKLGRARDRVYELKVTDAVEPVVINAYANVVPSERETD